MVFGCVFICSVGYFLLLVSFCKSDLSKTNIFLCIFLRCKANFSTIVRTFSVECSMLQRCIRTPGTVITNLVVLGHLSSITTPTSSINARNFVGGRKCSSHATSAVSQKSNMSHLGETVCRSNNYLVVISILASVLIVLVIECCLFIYSYTFCFC